MDYCGSPRDSWFYMPLDVSLNLSSDLGDEELLEIKQAERNLEHGFLKFLASFAQSYQPIHGYICLFLCIFGLITNILNFVTLTRPNMRTSINMILAAIALCDTGTMSTYLIYVLHFYVAHHGSACATYTYAWMNFILFHSLWSILLHSSSIWLVVLLALMRLAVMRRAKFSHSFLKPENVWKLMLYIYAPLGALCVPVIFTHSIDDFPLDGCQADQGGGSGVGNPWNSTNASDPTSFVVSTSTASLLVDRVSPVTEKGYTVVPSQAALRNNCMLLRLVLWINGVCFKLLPCLLLALSIWGLLRTLHEAKERNNRVLRRRSDAQKCKYFNSRTTKMLVAILSIFLITELPQALVATMSGLNPHDIYFKVYPAVGDVLDLLSLLNSAINFLLYCAMSSRFRSTFVELFAPKSLRMAMRRRRRGFSVSDNEAVIYGVTVTAGGLSLPARSELIRRSSGPASCYGTTTTSTSTTGNNLLLVRPTVSTNSALTTEPLRRRQEFGGPYTSEMRSLAHHSDNLIKKRRSTMLTLLNSGCDSPAAPASSSPSRRSIMNRFSLDINALPP